MKGVIYHVYTVSHQYRRAACHPFSLSRRTTAVQPAHVSPTELIYKHCVYVLVSNIHRVLLYVNHISYLLACGTDSQYMYEQGKRHEFGKRIPHKSIPEPMRTIHFKGEEGVIKKDCSSKYLLKDNKSYCRKL